MWLVNVYQDLVVSQFCANKAREAATVKNYVVKAKAIKRPWLRSTIGHNIATEIALIHTLLQAQDSVCMCQTVDAIVRLHMVQTLKLSAYLAAAKAGV